MLVLAGLIRACRNKKVSSLRATRALPPDELLSCSARMADLRRYADPLANSLRRRRPAGRTERLTHQGFADGTGRCSLANLGWVNTPSPA
jgi:hypothetical protein